MKFPGIFLWVGEVNDQKWYFIIFAGLIDELNDDLSQPHGIL